MRADVTLQINLSPGDISYAEATVPALVRAHRNTVKEVLCVVDCCRPQRTRMVDPDARFPLAQFAERVNRIRQIAERLQKDGWADRLVFVEPSSGDARRVVKKYAGWLVNQTHDFCGCGLASYFVGFDAPQTQYVLHYDADILIHQQRGFDWASEAIPLLQRTPQALAATPRISPPFEQHGQRDAPSLHDSDATIVAASDHWKVGWFSTRCFLADRSRIEALLPLISMRQPKYFGEIVARKLTQRGFPPSPEVMMHRRMQPLGVYRVDLRSERAFVLHPDDKGERFLRLLPGIIEAVHDGVVPAEQRGWENLRLDAWEHFLATERQHA